MQMNHYTNKQLLLETEIMPATEGTERTGPYRGNITAWVIDTLVLGVPNLRCSPRLPHGRLSLLSRGFLFWIAVMAWSHVTWANGFHVCQTFPTSYQKVSVDVRISSYHPTMISYYYYLVLNEYLFNYHYNRPKDYLQK